MKNTGFGGRVASLLSPVPKPSPVKPVAGALNGRSVIVTNFRKFYDRGDLPITV